MRKSQGRHKAGCVAIGLGIESGSNEILRNMNKRITVEQSEQALKDAKRAGLHVKVQLVLAYPGENEKTISEKVQSIFDQPDVKIMGARPEDFVRLIMSAASQ